MSARSVKLKVGALLSICPSHQRLRLIHGIPADSSSLSENQVLEGGVFKLSYSEEAIKHHPFLIKVKVVRKGKGRDSQPYYTLKVSREGCVKSLSDRIQLIEEGEEIRVRIYGGKLSEECVSDGESTSGPSRSGSCFRSGWCASILLFSIHQMRSKTVTRLRSFMSSWEEVVRRRW